jgi:hypothetical protein
MRRREFITLLGGAAAWPVVARAQQPTRLPTIGFFGSATSATRAVIGKQKFTFDLQRHSAPCRSLPRSVCGLDR